MKTHLPGREGVSLAGIKRNRRNLRGAALFKYRSVIVHAKDHKFLRGETHRDEHVVVGSVAPIVRNRIVVLLRLDVGAEVHRAHAAASIGHEGK